LHFHSPGCWSGGASEGDVMDPETRAVALQMVRQALDKAWDELLSAPPEERLAARERYIEILDRFTAMIVPGCEQ
jgi:hypothetical protein